MTEHGTAEARPSDFLTEEEQDDLDDYEGLLEDHDRERLILGPPKSAVRFDAFVSFALPDAMKRALEARARQHGVSRSAFLRAALMESLR